MNRIYVFALALVVFTLLTAGATIIDVPDDYPTIQQGIDASAEGDTALVQPGTYVENVDFHGHNIVVGSLFLTTGDASYISQTVIDGNSAGPVITFKNGEDNSATISGFTIQNGLSEAGGGIYCTGASPFISDNHITGNHSPWFGGGIYCDAVSSPIIANNIISGNSADWGGGGLYIDDSQPLSMQNVFSGNSTTAYGGGLLSLNNANPQIINSAFGENSAGYGGAVCCMFTSYPRIVNSILWGDSASLIGDEVFFDDASMPSFSYCDIRNVYPPGEGNIDIDPLFRNPANGDFHIMSHDCGDPDNSPCIDAGDPDIIDGLLDCSRGLGELRSDMGAYGGGDSATVGINDQRNELPQGLTLLRNYPNPFNSSTTIKIDIQNETFIRINIYNVLGRLVTTLIDGNRPAGTHEISWSAEGLSSGIYFARLETPSCSEVIRMTLLK